MTPGIPDYAARILAHVEEVDGCWRWNGNPDRVRGLGVRYPSGYGQIGRNLLTHRVVWEHLRGPIPAGLVLDHECHNRDLTCAGGPTCLHRRCVNPDHLAPKTTPQNARASTVSVTSINIRKSECPKGHPYDAANTYHRPDRPGRLCRICRADVLARCSFGHRNAPARERERQALLRSA